MVVASSAAIYAWMWMGASGHFDWEPLFVRRPWLARRPRVRQKDMREYRESGSNGMLISFSCATRIEIICLSQGTLAFMAVEALALRYLFLLKKNRKRFQKYAEAVVGGEQPKPVAEQTSEDPPFIHFALHDLESLLWIGIWMSFYHRTDCCPVETIDEKRKRRDESGRIFPTDSGYETRSNFLVDEDYFTRVVEGWVSTAFVPFLVSCRNLFDSLVEFYKRIEATFPQGLAHLSAKAIRQQPYQPAFPGAPQATEIYVQFRETFLHRMEASNGIKFVPVTGLVEEEGKGETEVDGPGSRKRKSERAHGSRKKTKTNS